MSKKPIRAFSREFKLKAVRRLLAGENVSALARELKVQRNDLYVWRDRFRAGGADGLRGPGRPRKAEAVGTAASGGVPPPGAAATSQLDAAHRRIAELERKIGQQQLELDFFRRALRQVKGARQPSDGSGVTGSTRSFKR
jgi:transposase-like protein